MRHARAAALDALEPLLADLRALGALSERSRGVFYLGSRAFLHFHEDVSGLFADIRARDGGFDRIKLDDPASAADLLARAYEALAQTGAAAVGASPPM